MKVCGQTCQRIWGYCQDCPELSFSTGCTQCTWRECHLAPRWVAAPADAGADGASHQSATKPQITQDKCQTEIRTRAQHSHRSHRTSARRSFAPERHTATDLTGQVTDGIPHQSVTQQQIAQDKCQTELRTRAPHSHRSHRTSARRSSTPERHTAA